MSDLFDDTTPEVDSSPQPSAPLAERLRPATLADVVGQQHLLGEGRPLRLAIEDGRLHSMILWGPPGVGKTTLAQLFSIRLGAGFRALSAVLSGVREIRDAVAWAEQNRRRGLASVVFVDEVHRFNKAQQDAFLPHVERGLITLIGATTENPAFEVNAALLSRAVVHVLEPLDDAALGELFARALRVLEPACPWEPEARAAVIAHADGDARRLLGLIEQAMAAAASQAVTSVRLPFLEQVLSRRIRRFDHGGDAFYDQISALHKSVRGSSPDAALYWLARMLDGGADARYLGRRLVRMASEDIGLADPRALEVTLGACQAFERLGSPEGELALAEAAVYLACAPKSNAVYVAYKAARAAVAAGGSLPVPAHLRNAPTALARQMGHGEDYRYAHDEPDAYAAGVNYFPEGMDPPHWYKPVPRGLEIRIGEKLAHWRDRDAAARSGGDG